MGVLRRFLMVEKGASTVRRQENAKNLRQALAALSVELIKVTIAIIIIVIKDIKSCNREYKGAQWQVWWSLSAHYHH